MNNLPLLLDASEAITHYKKTTEKTDAEAAYVVGILSKEGYSNRKIREALDIPHVYTVTHLKRAALLTDEELSLWHKNPTRITLGHVRAIAKFPPGEREKLLRNLLAKKVPVFQFEQLAQGRVESGKDTDIKRYETLMSEVIGRPVKIKFNNARQTGSITLDFYSIDELDDIAKQLKFDPSDHL